jgi:hypothetical protein
MFAVLISYLPNFNVGQDNGMANATGSWNNGTAFIEHQEKLAMCFENKHVKRNKYFK